MGHTYYAVYEHIAFSTKNRIECLTSDIQEELFPYLAKAVNEMGCQALLVGGHIQHVHLLVKKSSTLLTGDLVKEIKRPSSQWLKTKKSSLDHFAWQDGYGAFSVSYSNLDRVQRYIENQDEHHQKSSWEMEFRSLLVKHGMEFDEKYYLD